MQYGEGRHRLVRSWDFTASHWMHDSNSKRKPRPHDHNYRFTAFVEYDNNHPVPLVMLDHAARQILPDNVTLNDTYPFVPTLEKMLDELAFSLSSRFAPQKYNVYFRKFVLSIDGHGRLSVEVKIEDY
jgi:6-pyruvoyl-tetrahydropterin synthase